MSAGSQWRNGKAEACIKSVKSTLAKVFKNTNWDFLEYETVLKRTAFLLNNCPLELMTNSGDRQGDDASEVRMICPNDLLIPPNGPMLRGPTFTGMAAKKRLEFMGRKVAEFHEVYVRSSIDSLFLMPAHWVKRRADLEPGDLVFMIKESISNKSFQWGKVKAVYPDSLGLSGQSTLT